MGIQGDVKDVKGVLSDTKDEKDAKEMWRCRDTKGM
jgi:hypothetical protein